jgi:hypothetical protein
MSYADAKQLRGQSFGSLMSKKLVDENQGIGESFRNALSDKSRATTTGIKEKFDPMNIAKFMTGGSNLAPAIVGKMTGRSQEDIQHFASNKKGADTASKVGPLEQMNSMDEILLKIFELLKSTNENNIKHREHINAFAEEEKMEKDRRHKELLDAIKGKKGKKETAEKVEEQTGMGIADIISNILNSFGGARTALSILSNVGKFFLLNPFGAALLLGTATISMLARDENPEQTNKMLQGAMGGPTADAQAIVDAVKDTTEIDRRKQNILANRPERMKSRMGIFGGDVKLQEQYLKEIGWDESTGLTAAEKKAGFTGLDEKGNPVKATATGTSTETPGKTPGLSPGEEVVKTPEGGKPTASPVAGGGGSSAAATETKPAESASAAPKSSAMPTSSPNPSEKLNSAISENQNMKLEENVTAPTVVNNSVNKVTNSNSPSSKFVMPMVRNQEATFRRMILNSTRVV